MTLGELPRASGDLSCMCDSPGTKVSPAPCFHQVNQTRAGEDPGGGRERGKKRVREARLLKAGVLNACSELDKTVS